MAEYKVQFEVFEGPLDLLLYLVKKEEVDIYEVNLTKIATQFVEYIELMRQLIRQLVEYRKFKDAAGHLREREAEQENTFPRVPGRPEFDSTTPPSRPAVSLFDLINAVSNILKRFQQNENARDIFEDKWTVSEKIDLLRRTMASRPALKFSELFQETTSRAEVVVTFLALHELIRLKQIVVVQPTPFSEIEIRRAPGVIAPVVTSPPIGSIPCP